MLTNNRASLAATLVLALCGLMGCAGSAPVDPTFTGGGDDGGGGDGNLPPFAGDDGSAGSSSNDPGGGGSSGGAYYDGGVGYPNGPGSSSSGGGGSGSSGGSGGGKYSCGVPVCSLDGNNPPDCGCLWTDSNGSLHLWGCVPNVGCGCYDAAHTFAPSGGTYAGACANAAAASKAALAACCM